MATGGEDITRLIEVLLVVWALIITRDFLPFVNT